MQPANHLVLSLDVVALDACSGSCPVLENNLNSKRPESGKRQYYPTEFRFGHSSSLGSGHEDFRFEVLAYHGIPSASSSPPYPGE
jgi:hypothetical protein